MLRYLEIKGARGIPGYSNSYSMGDDRESNFQEEGKEYLQKNASFQRRLKNIHKSLLLIITPADLRAFSYRRKTWVSEKKPIYWWYPAVLLHINSHNASYVFKAKSVGASIWNECNSFSDSRAIWIAANSKMKDGNKGSVYQMKFLKLMIRSMHSLVLPHCRWERKKNRFQC